MTKTTKAERSAAAKKGAATRKENEAKSGASDVKRAAGTAASAVRTAGAAAVGVASDAAKAVSKRVGY